MADLVVGLAKSVVEGALTKAQAAIDEEAKLRQSAQRDLVFIVGEFEMMHSFLMVAKVERVENEVVRTWVRQVRELAYDVEDCIEFVVHLDKKTSWWFRMFPPCMATTPLVLDEAVYEIEHLKARVEDVSTRNARYSLIGDTGSKPIAQQLQQDPLPGAAVAATTFDMLVQARGATKREQGLGDLTRLITKKLEDVNGLQVISVWGAGGNHGTTSIIRKTFNHQEICQNFTYRSWVKLMHPFSPHEFILSMMAQFYANSCKEETATIGMHVLTKMKATHEDLFIEFERLVTEERYLVVLEGLTNMVDWDAIRMFLPDTKKCSWIILSTQQPEIASLCVGHSYQILELKKFSNDHSVCALFKASQGDGGKGKKPIVIKDSQGNGDKGKKPIQKEEIRISSSYEKITSLNKKAADEEWAKKNIEPLVGRDSQMDELSTYPAKARVNSPPVMAVWGIAGIGKSALVKNLFDRMLHSDQFDKYYWVDVSHPFNIRDLYLGLLSDSHSENDPIEECHDLIKNDRCLIVIDGLRSTKEWELMQSSLVSKHSRSVITVITTEASIATYCTNNEDLVFNVKALEASAAFDLFKKQMADERSSFEFPDLDFDERNTRPYQEIRMQHGDVREIDHRSAKRATKSLPRARWNHQMKAFLIELLNDYNVPGYRTQNAWSNEAWNSITNRLNQKFSLSLAVAQVKQKEQDLKKDFRSVKDLVGESGFGWDPNRMMVVAPDEVWQTFGERMNKDALRWREKSFPYFDDLFGLYEGRYAEGKNRHGMDHYASKAKQHSHGPAANIHAQPSLPLHGVDEPYVNLEDEDEIGVAGLSQQQFSSKSPMSSTQTPSQFVATPEMHEAKRAKRRKSSEFQERYLKLKKEEIDRFAAIEEKKLEDPYSISKCVTKLEGLRGLQISDMLMAADIFKSKDNRELFLSFSSDELRLGWVRNQIGANQANQ